MGIISGFFKTIKDLLGWGSKVDEDNRKFIRNTVLELCTTLESSTAIVSVYMVQGKWKSDSELAMHLQNARTKLLHTFNEFTICSNIYTLGDKLNRVFDTTKHSIEAGQATHIKALVDQLRQGEQGIIDDVSTTLTKLNDMGTSLLSGACKREDVDSAIEGLIERMTAEQAEIKEATRKVIAEM